MFDQNILLHPVIDFLLLGGLSLLLIPLLFIVSDQTLPALVALSFVIADFINHPHFAASYQIFYGRFFESMQDSDCPTSLKLRIIWSGLVVPCGLVCFFGYCFFTEDVYLLGYSVNLMLFLVGWHYVKQGYGILMLDSRVKGCGFSSREKQVFRINAYACWLYFWLLANTAFAESHFWGVSYFSFNIPKYLAHGALAAMMATSTVLCITLIHAQIKQQKRLPIIGLAAYLVSTYCWLAGRLHPALILFIPALHSLQYLTVVTRYAINKERKSPLNSRHRFLRLTIFALLSLLLGYYGFLVLPSYFDGNAQYNKEIFGSSVFMLFFWIFINIHHYFIDNALWRNDNKPVGQYLV